ncbi:MAG: tRNA lysidine(34) synthetase TilS [Pseudomonadota bacterium]
MPGAPNTRLADRVELANRFRRLLQFDSVLLAVSGGSDSVALLRLVDLWSAELDGSGPAISVATVDHGLREGSAEEADFVAQLASSLGYDHVTLRWQGTKPETALQAQAREARYRLLIERADQLHGDTIILTAHTQDDQAETVIMRLARGSGPDGMAGIPNELSRDGLTILRPVLDVGRSELRAFLTELNQSWCEDPSNSLVEFERIRVRNAQSERKKLDLTDKALALSARRMHRASQSLQQVSRELLISVVGGQDLLRFGAFTWCPERMAKYGSEVGIRCLRQIIKMVGGNTNEPNLGQVENLYGQIGDDGFRGTTLHGARLLRQFHSDSPARFLILRETGRNGLPKLKIVPDMRTLWDHRFAVRTSSDVGEDFTIGPLRREELAEGDLQSRASLPGLSADMTNELLLTLPVIRHHDLLHSVPHFQAGDGKIEIDPDQFLERFVL